MRKLFVVLLTCFSLLLGQSVNAAESKTEEFFINQEESIEAYNIIEEAFDKNKESQEFSFYGGAFIDDKGILTVNILSDSMSVKNYFRSLVPDFKIKFNKVDVTEEELNTFEKVLIENVKVLSENGITLFHVATDIADSKLVIGLSDTSKSTQKVVEKIIPKKYFYLEEVNEYEKVVTSDIKAGQQIEAGGYYASVGFTAKLLLNTDVLVSTGHWSAPVGSSVKLDGVTIGTLLTKYREGGAGGLDFSLVELNSNADATNLVDIHGEITSVYEKNIPQGTYLAGRGGSSGVLYGQLLDPSFSTYISVDGVITLFEDMYKMNFHAQGGDSGGMLGWSSSAYTYRLVGNIVSIQQGSHTTCGKIKHILDRVNLDVYTS